MFGIKLTTGFLTLFPKTALSFELRNPAPMGDDADVIQESFMFTSSVPMDANNRKKLINPSRLDNANFFLENEDCSVWCQGIEVFRGLLTVRSATSASAEISIKINTISKLKELSLSELNHDTVDLAAKPNAINYLTATCTNPNTSDFICFPVWNPDFYGDTDNNVFGNSRYQNLWDIHPTNVSTLKIAGKSAVTPFLKVSYLLRKMAETTAFTLENNWQTTRELQWLCSYNNRSIVQWNADASAYTLDNKLELKNHVSKVKSSDYLKNIAKLHNLGIYVNFFDRSLDIVPNNTILHQSPRHDWTKKVISDYTKSENLNFPTRFGYASTPLVLGDISALTRYPYDAPLATSPEGLYLNPIGRRYLHKPDDLSSELIAVELDDYVHLSKSEKNAFSSPLQTLPNARVFMGSFGAASCPAIRQKGKFKIQNGEESDASFDDRLLFFRGMTDFRKHDGTPFPNSAYFCPLASSEDATAIGYRIKTGWDTSLLDPSQVPPPYAAANVENTLAWNGEKGLFNRHHSAWLTMLEAKRDIKLSVGLSIKEIRAFSFKDKIRIGNRELLARKLRVTLTEFGIAPTEAELITV